MALYKEHEIVGGTVTLNMDMAGVVVKTSEAVWVLDSDGQYVKVSIENGSPITRVSVKNDEGGRKTMKSVWADIVVGK